MKRKGQGSKKKRRAKRSGEGGGGVAPPAAPTDGGAAGLEFEDPFGEEFIEEEIIDGDGDTGMMEDDDDMEGGGGGGAGASTDGAGPKIWRAGVDELAEGEVLDFDSSAYLMLHRMTSEWPCLSFDFIRDKLGMNRTRFPATIYAVSGTQAEGPENNSLTVMKLTDLHKTIHDDAEDSEELSEDDDHLDDDPVLDHRKVRHPGGVNRVRSMPQQPNVLASWADTGHVHVWDVGPQLASLDGPPPPGMTSTPAPLQTFAGHTDEGFAIDWSGVAAGRLASGDCDKNIHVWMPSAGGAAGWAVSEAYVGHTASVEDIKWSPTEENVFVSCSVDKTVRVWDARTRGRPMLGIEAHATDVNVMAWNSLVSYLLVSGADDGSFKIWDLRNFKAEAPVANFHWHRQPISSVEWHPTDESTLAVAAADNTITVWDLSLEEDAEGAVNKKQAAEAGADDLPPQLLFVHQGQTDVKELHLHPQLPGVIMSTAADGFHVFKPANIDPGDKWTGGGAAGAADADM